MHAAVALSSTICWMPIPIPVVVLGSNVYSSTIDKSGYGKLFLDKAEGLWVIERPLVFFVFRFSLCAWPASLKSREYIYDAT